MPDSSLGAAVPRVRMSTEPEQPSLRRDLTMRDEELASALRSKNLEAVILTVDQAEELVTTSDSRSADNFVEVLGALTTSPVGIWAQLVFRSQFVTSALQSAKVAPLLQDPIFVGPIERGRLGAVIEGPKSRVGHSPRRHGARRAGRPSGKTAAATSGPRP